MTNNRRTRLGLLIASSSGSIYLLVNQNHIRRSEYSCIVFEQNESSLRTCYFSDPVVPELTILSAYDE